MAQDNFINITAATQLKDGSYAHQPAHASASASDMTISWDHTKFTKKSALMAALKQAEQFINTRTDLAP